MREVPVAYVVFDILYADGELLLDHPLRSAQVLDQLFARCRIAQLHDDASSVPERKASAFRFERRRSSRPGWVFRAPVATANSAEELELYSRAGDRGNEGLMIKDLESLYMPGRRGRWWLKLKRELATLDVVVTAAEFGHGKRIHVLSDYTFAVRKGEAWSTSARPIQG